ncbi:hypothetical protein AJ80_07804 [Polytolypa hystricis UAMH7299]|uniref:WSC domain-containing protein n=1 Tax=Polytolypa hystricis (strain UAMH7299) TaxID=1447883 RepID=A0A2B7XIU2_POLH7|nr:hypothetical protein AJ80_07804 [Polytolypa hystricis UAMH7299]
MKSSLLTGTALLLFPLLVSSSFDLDTQGPDWSYTTDDLADTTSQTCKDAYSAPIDCSDTLLGIAASMRPAFDPTEEDMRNTCTDTCRASLESYVQGVKKACTKPGDRAREFLGGACTPCRFTERPVELVGRIFQYVLERACRKDKQDKFCYIENSPYAGVDFDCDDACTMSFFTQAHDHPASDWWFNYYSLTSRGQYWAEEFEEGWKRVQECGGKSSKTRTWNLAEKTAAAATAASSSSPSSVADSSSRTASATPVTVSIDATGTVAATSESADATGDSVSGGASPTPTGNGASVNGVHGLGVAMLVGMAVAMW